MSTTRPDPAPVPLVALLVGIDAYANRRIGRLRGCRNDVAVVAQLLTGPFGAASEGVRTLLDEAATRAAILGAFKEHLTGTARRWHEAGQPPAPAFLFHHSGHGSQAPDPTRTKPNALDETIVPYDARTPGVYDIKDWELGQLLDELARYTDNVTVVLNSCHSGSGTRAPHHVAVRGCEPDERTQPVGRPAPAAGTRALAPESGWALPDRHALFS